MHFDKRDRKTNQKTNMDIGYCKNNSFSIEPARKKEPFKLIQVNLTYRCNRNCSYCYAKNLETDYENDMTLEDFKSLLDWLEKNGATHFNIVGGEPTLHPLVGEMLSLAAKKKFRVTAFTNGLFPKTFLDSIDNVHSFLINYNHKRAYTEREYHLLHEHLEYLKQKNKPVTLAFNITPEIESCDYVIEAAKAYNIKSVNMDLIIPNSLKNNDFVSCKGLKENKERIKGFLKKFDENKIRVKFTRPLPFCIFRDMAKERKNVFSSRCSSGYKIVSINPDLSIFPCLSMFFKGPKITSFNSPQDIVSFYQNAVSDFRWDRYLYPECKYCVYRIRKKCQGSCLCYKCSQFSLLEKQYYRIFSQYNLTELDNFVKEVDLSVVLLNDMFGKPKRRFKIYIFNNRKDMIYYSGSYSYPDWVKGFASKDTYYQYCAGGPVKNGRRLTHELCHVYLNEYKTGDIPLWLEEGFCEHIIYRDMGDSRLKALAKEKKIFPFDKLFSKEKTGLLKYDDSPLDRNIAYAQSCSMVNYLVNKFGTGMVMKLLKGDYKDFKEHFEELTRQKFGEIEKEWLKKIKILPDVAPDTNG